MDIQHFSEALISYALADRNIVWRPARPPQAGPQQLLDLSIEAYVPFIGRGILYVTTTFRDTIAENTANTWADFVLQSNFYANPEVLNTILIALADRIYEIRNVQNDFIYIAIVTNLCGFCVAVNRANIIQNAIAGLVYYLGLKGDIVGTIDVLYDYGVRNVLPR